MKAQIFQERNATMLVETFEMTELDHEGTPECEAEAIELIEKLHLNGQQKLLRRTEDGDGTSVTRCPYRKLTKDEHAVYGLLCPKVSNLREYADGPIPVRVLQVAAHALDVFEEVQVWSPEDSDVKDPVLIGCNGRRTWGGFENLFLLARWGEVLEPFAKLLSAASALRRDKYIAGLNKAICQCRAEIENATHLPDVEIVHKTPPSLYF